MICGGSSGFYFLSSFPILSGFGRHNVMFNLDTAYYEMNHATW
jgi:hypothetical protein